MGLLEGSVPTGKMLMSRCGLVARRILKASIIIRNNISEDLVDSILESLREMTLD
jgi:hypothetical protein